MEENNENLNVNQPVFDDETTKKLGEASLNRINMVAKMAKEYFRALNGGRISSFELFQVGIDTILAGFQLVSRSHDMDELNVDERIKSVNATLNTVLNVLNKVYLNPEVVANQVAQAALEAVKRKGLR